MRLANYTVSLEVPDGVPEGTLDQLCEVLDTVDLRQRLENAASSTIRQNDVLCRYVVVEASE